MNKNERRSTLAEAYPAAVRPLRRRRPAPAALAQLAVRPVPFGAALGTPPRGEVSTAPRPHVSIQAGAAVRVRRMRHPVTGLPVNARRRAGRGLTSPCPCPVSGSARTCGGSGGPARRRTGTAPPLGASRTAPAGPR